MSNECESCGKKTRKKEVLGIAHCQICINNYNLCTKLSIQELIKAHKDEFEKIRDKKIEEIFKK